MLIDHQCRIFIPATRSINICCERSIQSWLSVVVTTVQHPSLGAVRWSHSHAIAFGLKCFRWFVDRYVVVQALTSMDNNRVYSSLQPFRMKIIFRKYYRRTAKWRWRTVSLLGFTPLVYSQVLYISKECKPSLLPNPIGPYIKWIVLRQY